tara:strand:+ start:1383 stop:1637 length:255 start_codon:yes stop_codon:yes gene_type:complete
MKTLELKQKLEDSELKTIQDLNSDFGQLKIALGDLKLREHDIIEQIKVIKSRFVEEEKKLIDKYGAESVINLKTGEITKKEENG